jgi:hypothetical protein
VEGLPRNETETFRVDDLDPYLYHLLFREAKVMKEALEIDVLLLIQHSIFVIYIDPKRLYNDVPKLFRLPIEHLIVLIERENGYTRLSSPIPPLHEV